MSNRIVFIHGRGAKPSPIAEHRYIAACIAHGVARVSNLLIAEDNVCVAYYADCFESNMLPDDEYDHALAALFARDTAAHTRENYLRNRPVSVSDWRDKVSRWLSPMIRQSGYSENVAAHLAPELVRYARDATVRTRIRQSIASAMGSATNRVMLIAHSLGAAFALDAIAPNGLIGGIDTLLTIGAPLGDDALRQVFRNHNLLTQPPAIRQWVNVAAEDDY